MQKLRAMNYELSILSGDLTAPVQKLANELGITSYFSTQNPEQKAIRVSKAMMVGDGVNDALALSQARVSIAVQGGMEAAIQSAQAYSLKPGVSIVPIFLSTANLVRKTLRQNFILSTSYNFIGAFLSLTGHMNPLWAAVLMPASALTIFMASFIRLREVRS
jgi:P-type E1-E2 ATPase